MNVREIAEEIAKVNADNGFRPLVPLPEEWRPLSQVLMLMITELAECYEADRNGIDADDKLPQFDARIVELADVFIRLLDTVHERQWLDAFISVVEHKIEYNRSRGYRHGKRF